MKVVHLRSALAHEEREIIFWDERAAHFYWFRGWHLWLGILGCAHGACAVSGRTE